jgi:putative PEP-CTERM system TPR-repeat lipoprotein
MGSSVGLTFFYKIVVIVSFGVYFSPNIMAAEDGQLHYEKALSTYKEQRFDESMIHLKNALLSSPENLPSKILMGQLLAKSGQFEAAEIEFEEAINQGADISLFADVWGRTLIKRKAYKTIIDFKQFSGFSAPQQLTWQRLRALACMSSKDYDCAKQSYLKIGQLSVDKTEQFNGLANIQLSLKEYEKAYEYLQQASEINLDDPITWQLKGLVAKNRNKLDVALEYLQKSFELDPDDPYILRHLADVYLASNNNEAAKSTINTILTASPDDPFAILVNSWLQKDTTLGVKAEKKFQEMATKINNLPNEYVQQEHSLLFLRALVNFRRQKYEGAVRDFTNLRKMDDSDISAVILLAKSYIALGEERDAITLLEEKQQDLNTLPDVLVMLGDLYINNGKSFKTASLLETLQAEYPDNISVQLLEVKLVISRGQEQAGFERLDKLLSKHPDNETILFVHSVLNLQIQQFVKADFSISKLLGLKPNDPIKLNIKGAVLIKLNRIDEAQTYIEQALDIHPDLVSAKINLASTYYLQNDHPTSVRILNDILLKKPRYSPALLLLAKIQLTDKNFVDAHKNYRNVLIDNRRNIEALEGLTSIHLLKNEKQEALFQLNKLSKIESQNPKYIIQKAQLYLSLKDKENSELQIINLKRLAKDDAALMIALSKLQLLSADLQGAIHSLESAQNIQPKSLRVGIQLGELLLNNNLTSEAVIQVNLLSSKFNNSPEVTFLQGRLAEQQGQIDQANQYYLKTLDMNDQYELALGKLYSLLPHGVPPEPFKNKIDEIVSDHPERYFPRNLLAQYYYYTNNFAEAAFHYEILLGHEGVPNRSAMLNRLALVFMPTDILKSTEYAKQAYKLDNTNPQILTTYGWLLTQQAEPTAGLELLRKASARGQQTPNIHYYIAISLEKLGLYAEAKSELETLLDKKVDFPERQQAKALYQKLTES